MKVATNVEQIIEDIESIVPHDKLEALHQIDTIEWVKSSRNIFRIEKPDKPIKHLVAYFVVVDTLHKSILLGDHIKAQLWLPSGGHVEPHEVPTQTVEREMQEELRMPANFLGNKRTPLFVTQTLTVGLTPGHIDVNLWYLVRGGIHDKLWFDRAEYTDMNWFTFDEILLSHPAVFDEHMQRFTRKLQSHLI